MEMVISDLCTLEVILNERTNVSLSNASEDQRFPLLTNIPRKYQREDR